MKVLQLFSAFGFASLKFFDLRQTHTNTQSHKSWSLENVLNRFGMFTALPSLLLSHDCYCYCVVAHCCRCVYTCLLLLRSVYVYLCLYIDVWCVRVRFLLSFLIKWSVSIQDIGPRVMFVNSPNFDHILRTYVYELLCQIQNGYGGGETGWRAKNDRKNTQKSESAERMMPKNFPAP